MDLANEIYTCTMLTHLTERDDIIRLLMYGTGFGGCTHIDSEGLCQYNERDVKCNVRCRRVVDVDKDLPDYIKIPGAVLIAHGEIGSVRIRLSNKTSLEEPVAVFDNGWLIFVKESPVTKGETG